MAGALWCRIRDMSVSTGAELDRHNAMLEAMADAQWIEEARKRNLGLDALSGEALQQIVSEAVSTPREILDQARKYIGQ